MAIPVNYVSISKCDNELYIVAAPTDSTSSTELCHLKSGFDQPVSYIFNPGDMLDPAENPYNLFIIGINWGAEANFQIAMGVTGPSASEMTTFSYYSPSSLQVWSPTDVPQITVSIP